MNRLVANTSAALLLIVSPAYGQGGFTAAYYFGDSLSDTGNTYDRDGLPASPPYNRSWSNGPVWPEYFAADMGLPAPEASRLGGPNFSWGGAQTGNGLSAVPDFPVPNIGAQIDEFSTRGNSLRETDLIVLWGGHNDPYTQIPASTTGQNISDHVRTLYEMGGRRFLIGNFAGFDVGPYNSAFARSVRSAKDLDGIEIAILDLNGFAGEAFGNPGRFEFTNLWDPACPECTREAVIDPNFTVSADGIVDDPDEYFSWDGTHPTTVTHKLIAARAARAAMTIAAPRLRGDLNNDWMLSAEDANILSIGIKASVFDSALDFNGDNLLDLADLDSWVHDLKGTYVGDANLDGEFNRRDLIELLQAGTFGLDVEAGWAEGDWTGDGRFDRSDIVLALQDGGYGRGGLAAINAIPEPSCALLLLVGVIGILRLRQPR